MKKLLGIALILAMIFAFAACGSNATDDSQNNGDSTTELLAERYAFEEGGFSTSRGEDAYEIAEVLSALEYRYEGDEREYLRAAALKIAAGFLAQDSAAQGGTA